MSGLPSHWLILLESCASNLQSTWLILWTIYLMVEIPTFNIWIYTVFFKRQCFTTISFYPCSYNFSSYYLCIHWKSCNWLYFNLHTGFIELRGKLWLSANQGYTIACKAYIFVYKSWLLKYYLHSVKFILFSYIFQLFWVNI